MKTLIAFCASLTLAALVPFGAATPAAAQPTGNACFWPRSINGFRSIDNQTVYLRVSRNVWALEFFAPCLGVDWAHGVGLRSRTGGTICEGRGNAVDILVRGRAFGPQRCAVHNIRRLTAEEVAALPPQALP
ncbi:MAG TPA: DUF6491 family protein [Caulobacteraceae bacterium]|jgi:hypothetical protein